MKYRIKWKVCLFFEEWIKISVHCDPIFFFLFRRWSSSFSVSKLGHLTRPPRPVSSPFRPWKPAQRPLSCYRTSVRRRSGLSVSWRSCTTVRTPPKASRRSWWRPRWAEDLQPLGLAVPGLWLCGDKMEAPPSLCSPLFKPLFLSAHSSEPERLGNVFPQRGEAFVTEAASRKMFWLKPFLPVCFPLTHSLVWVDSCLSRWPWRCPWGLLFLPSVPLLFLDFSSQQW